MTLLTPEEPPESHDLMNGAFEDCMPHLGFQRPSTSIFVIYWPGTTISPRKRLVMSTFKVAVEDVPEDDSAAAFTAFGVGSRYS